EQSEPAVIIDRLRAESLSPCQDAADRKPSAGEFLRDKAVFEYTKPHAAVLGWNGNAEPALRGHLIDKTPRHLPLLGIKLVGNWEHDILGKGAGRKLQFDTRGVSPGRLQIGRLRLSARFGRHAIWNCRRD